jgi:hypothetical protein
MAGRNLLRVASGGATILNLTIDDNSAIFSVSGDDYYVNELGDIDWRDQDAGKAGTWGAVELILNVRGDRVIAMKVPNSWVDAESTEVFAVFNSMTNIPGAQRLTGFVDGVAGSLVTEDRGVFVSGYLDGIALWKLDVADGTITDVIGTVNAFTTGTAVSDQSNILTISGSALDSVGGVARVSFSSDVIVYRADGADDPTYSLSRVNAITRDAVIYLYNTDDDYPADVATVIIWHRP